MIVDNIHNNFIDYKKFFTLIYKVLVIYDKDSEPFKLTIALMAQIAKGLLRSDPESTEMMFEEFLLPELIKISDN